MGQKQLSRPAWIAGAFIPVFIIFISGFHHSFLLSTVSFLLLLLLCITAFPITWHIFGKLELALIIAFPAGFLLHSLFLSVTANHFGVSNWTFFCYFAAVLSGSLYWIKRQKFFGGTGVPASVFKSWSNRDLFSLFLWIAGTLILVALPFLRVGQETDSGYAYRAYFNADFFRTMGVIGSLMTHAIPPDNPYFAGEVLNYHWLMCILPAFWLNLWSDYRPDFLLVQFSLFMVVTFSAALFVVIRNYTSSRRSIVILFLLLFFGGGYQCIIIFREILSKDMPWHVFTTYNIDGILRWLWNVPQVDRIYRCMLYAPQHLAVLTTGLMLLSGWNPKSGVLHNLFFFVLLCVGMGFSSFIALLLIGVFGSVLAIAAFRSSTARLSILICGITGLAFAALYVFDLKLFSAESQELVFGLEPAVKDHLGAYLILNWGSLLIFGNAGIFYHSQKVPVRILLPVLLASLAVILFCRLPITDRSVFSIKLGYVVSLILIILSAGFFDRLMENFRNKGKWIAAVFALGMMPSAATALMEMYNHQDIKNEKFTTTISRSHFNVLRWIRENTPATAVIQNLHLENEGYTDKFVSEIPPFAARSVFLGDPILSQLFQIPAEHVTKRTEMLCAVMNSTSPGEIYRTLSQTGIDYLYFEGDEASHIQDQLEEPYFEKVEEEGDIVLFRVKTRKQENQAAPLKEGNEINEDRADASIRFGKNFYEPEFQEGCEKARWMSLEAPVILQASESMTGEIVFNAFALGRPRAMEIYLNGSSISKATASDRGSLIVVPVTLKSGKNTITIRPLESPESPSAYSLGNDPRLLSFKIFRFHFRHHATKQIHKSR